MICILPKNLGLLWLCKANALLLQLPCGAEFELNVDALYMSLTNFPSLGIKGRAIMLYFIIVFILLVTELHVIYFWLHVLCTQVTCNMLLFASIMYFYRSNKNYIFPRCTLFNLEISSMKVGPFIH